MKVRPILFSGPMVCALLAGSKTQTRRQIKLKTGDTFDEYAALGAIQEWRPFFMSGQHVGYESVVVHCPYGMPGDLLFVRETHWINPDIAGPSGVAYRADGEFPPHMATAKWRSSIHMPPWASRLTLEITNVRVERLQDISDEDVEAEGMPVPCHGRALAVGCMDEYASAPQAFFALLWASINGEDSWRANPWVWALTFAVHRQNVDALIAKRESAA